MRWLLRVHPAAASVPVPWRRQNPDRKVWHLGLFRGPLQEMFNLAAHWNQFWYCMRLSKRHPPATWGRRLFTHFAADYCFKQFTPNPTGMVPAFSLGCRTLDGYVSLICTMAESVTPPTFAVDFQMIHSGLLNACVDGRMREDVRR